MQPEHPHGPLVEPFPWTAPKPERMELPHKEFARLVERFQVAEELIRVRDALRLALRVGFDDALSASHYIKMLEHRFDGLEFGYAGPR